jgi:hypothetical protein
MTSYPCRCEDDYSFWACQVIIDYMDFMADLAAKFSGLTICLDWFTTAN